MAIFPDFVYGYFHPHESIRHVDSHGVYVSVFVYGCVGIVVDFGCFGVCAWDIAGVGSVSGGGGQHFFAHAHAGVKNAVNFCHDSGDVCDVGGLGYAETAVRGSGRNVLVSDFHVAFYLKNC